MTTRAPEPWDAVVIGAGMAGLGAAVTLAGAGRRVLVVEAIDYPGGCAATFERDGHHFEAGATLLSGLSPGEGLERFLARHAVEVATTRVDPGFELRTPGWRLPVAAERASFLDALGAVTPIGEAHRRVWTEVGGLAAPIWAILAGPLPIPTVADLARVARQPGVREGLLGATPALVRGIGRPLASLLRRAGLDPADPLWTLLNVTSMITVQAGAAQAEAPLAAAAVDYLWRGIGHANGGMGALAMALVHRIRALGGEVRFRAPARALQRDATGWTVDAGPHRARAPRVFANLLPGALAGLAEGAPLAAGHLRRLDRATASGWGAVMRYLVLDADADLPPQAFHLELVSRPGETLVDGNHTLVSVGPRPTDGAARTATMSTHVALERWRADPASVARDVDQSLGAALARLAPEVHRATRAVLPASPRTFRRYTLRAEGRVGGVPRAAGLLRYPWPFPTRAGPDLWLVGDSVFPGQSTLATLLGGESAARDALRT